MCIRDRYRVAYRASSPAGGGKVGQRSAASGAQQSRRTVGPDCGGDRQFVQNRLFGAEDRLSRPRAGVAEILQFAGSLHGVGARGAQIEGAHPAADVFMVENGSLLPAAGIAEHMYSHPFRRSLSEGVGRRYPAVCSIIPHTLCPIVSHCRSWKNFPAAEGRKKGC